MPWQLAIGLSIIANVLTSLIQRRYSLRSKAPPTFPSAISYLFGVMPVGLIVGFFILPHHVYWSWWLGLLLLTCGSSMAISGWTAFKAVKMLPVIAYQTIGRFTSIVAIALGWIVLGEGLGVWQLIGAIILLAATVLAIWAPTKQTKNLEHAIHVRAVLLTLLACTTLAIGLVTEKGILGHMQPGGVLIFGWGSQTLAMLLLATKDISQANIRMFKAYEIKWSALMGLANGTGGAFYVYALNKSNNISLITAVLSITLPLTVLGAYVLLRERENQKFLWLGLALGFIGLLITAL